MNKTKTNDFIRFLSYVKPYTGMIILAAIGGIVKFGTPLLVPQIIRKLIDEILLNPSLSFEIKYKTLLLWTLGMIGVFIFFYAPWTYIRHYFAGKAGHRSVFDLRCDLYDRIIRMSLSFFHKNRTGEIATRLINDIPQAQNLVGNALTNIWMDGVALIAVLFFLFKIDIQVTFVALSTFPLYIFFFKKFGNEIRESSYKVQKDTADMAGHINERIAGSMIIHAFNREDKEEEDFQKNSEKLLQTTMKTVKLQSINLSITSVLTQISPLLVILFGGWRVLNHKLTVGELIAVTMYLSPLYLPVQRFAELNVILANSLSSLRRIFEVMDQQPEIKDLPHAIKLKKIKGCITFENVSFSYDRKHKLLHNISFTVNPAQTTAIVGPSGSGKTTLVNLIPRFFDPVEGRILIDNYDIRQIRLKSLRSHIGLVLQEPIIFSGTIRENILYGKPDASEKELIMAAKSANIYDLIQSLPQKWETPIGERGTFLSGGQKQRLTLARAFIKNPEILILDEATSALDSENESLIQEALQKLMRGRTVIVIAHRLSTIINADKIIVLRKGYIVGEGTHEKLIKTNSVYKNLYIHQFGFKSK